MSLLIVASGILYKIVVDTPDTLVFTTDLLPSGTEGVAYFYTLRVSGGIKPYTWTITSGQMPDGLSLSPDGVILGTPNIAYDQNFITFCVVDASGIGVSKSLPITINSGESINTINANTYYVATTGDDSDPGTISSPWRTAEHAFNTAIAGDTVKFMAGDYYANNLTVANSGSPGNYITFRNYKNDIVNIYMYETNWTGLYCAQSYINIIGLRFHGDDSQHLVYGNTADGYYSCRYGLYFINCDHILVQNCYVGYTYWCGLYCTNCNNITYDGVELDHVRQVTYSGEECMSICKTYSFEVKNCKVHDGGNPALGIVMKESCHNGSVHDSEVYNLSGMYNAGIYVSPIREDYGSSYNINIYNNLVHNIPLGCGISISDENPNSGYMAGSVYNIRCWNNIIYDCQRGGVYITQMGGKTSSSGLYGYTDFHDIYIYNNPFYSNGDKRYVSEFYLASMLPEYSNNIVWRNNISYQTQNLACPIYDPNGLYLKGKLIVDHNLWYNSGGKWMGGISAIKGTDIVESDPLFASATNYDFHLAINSPAKDTGSTSFAPLDDYDGTPRPEGITNDIGAYEYKNGISSKLRKVVIITK